jgi:hypothetical protein
MTTSSNTSSEMDFGIGRAPESCVSYQTDVAIIGSGYAGLAAAIVRISWGNKVQGLHESTSHPSLFLTRLSLYYIGSSYIDSQWKNSCYRKEFVSGWQLDNECWADRCCRNGSAGARQH